MRLAQDAAFDRRGRSARWCTHFAVQQAIATSRLASSRGRLRCEEHDRRDDRHQRFILQFQIIMNAGLCAMPAGKSAPILSPRVIAVAATVPPMADPCQRSLTGTSPYRLKSRPLGDHGPPAPLPADNIVSSAVPSIGSSSNHRA